MQRRSPLTTASLCVRIRSSPSSFYWGASGALGRRTGSMGGERTLLPRRRGGAELGGRTKQGCINDVHGCARGHLATITSEAENTFITTQLGILHRPWLGGEQLPDSEEPAGGWQWSPGEPWVYTNWDSGEPNNTYFGGWGKEATEQSEERLHYHHDGTHWNDLPNDPEVVTRVSSSSGTSLSIMTA